MINISSGLIIVDVQNDFCAGGALEVPQSDAIFAHINAIAPLFDTVVATKDWHPHDHISFASAHSGRAVHDVMSTVDGEQHLWPDHCVRGSYGATLHSDVHREPITLVIHKGSTKTRDSYSAFFENDHTTSTGLSGYLKDRGITTVFVCGLATEYCVFATARDAIRCGFATSVVTDASAGIDIPTGSVAKALHVLQEEGATLCASSSLMS